ncbi:MAG: sulfotransferase [Pseudoxanthomonas sp.]
MDATSALLLRQAATLIGQGPAQRAAAIDCLRRLLMRCPEHADSWFNLGYLLRQDGDFEAALQAYAQALRHGVAEPQEAHLNRAVIYSDHLHRHEQAKAELAAALAIAPHDLPALLNLGNLHEEQGERDQAIACYQRMLAIVQSAPAQPQRQLALEALARLAHLQPPASAQDPLLTQLRQAAEANGVDDSTRANLLFALGRACDGLGLADPAFAAFARAKHCAHRRAPAYSAAHAEARMQRLIAAFAQPQPEHAADQAAPVPVFICGMFRSGSTLLEQALAAHPQVAAGGELEILPRMLAGPLAPFPDTMGRLAAGDLAQLAARYRRELARSVALPPDVRCFTDKRPDNFLLIGLIKRLFPAARIVHSVRNPLDNALGIFMQHLNPRAFPYAGRLQDIGHYYGQHERLMRHWQALYPESIHRFDYDAYVARPRETLSELLRFLGLDWDERCLSAHALKNAVRTASYWQVRRSLYTDASGRWRRYAQHLGPLREALRRTGVTVSD